MDEYVHRVFLREEEFLEGHYETVDIVVQRLGQQWQPNFQCSDLSRNRRDLLLAKGCLQELLFDSAVLFHGKKGLSSIRIYLRSSGRLLIVSVSWPGREAVVEILADLPQPVTPRSYRGKVIMLTLELLHENRSVYPVRKPAVVDQGITKFLVALFEAEKGGNRTDINKIGFHDVETALSVFKRCGGRIRPAAKREATGHLERRAAGTPTCPSLPSKKSSPRPWSRTEP